MSLLDVLLVAAGALFVIVVFIAVMFIRTFRRIFPKDDDQEPFQINNL